MGTLLCFKVNVDGTITEVKAEGALKEKLNTEECYIIVSEEYRKVYLWRGFNSNVRSKFNLAKRGQDIRGQLSMNYRPVALNEGEEDSEFIKLIGGKTEWGILRVYEEDDRRWGKKFDPSDWPAIFKDP